MPFILLVVLIAQLNVRGYVNVLMNVYVLDEKEKEQESKRQAKIRQEIEARAQVSYEDERDERASREREEHFALALEEKKPEIATGKRFKKQNCMRFKYQNFKGLI